MLSLKIQSEIPALLPIRCIILDDEEESIVERENVEYENEDADESIDKSELTISVMKIHQFVMEQRYDSLISSLIYFEEKFLKKLR